MKILMKNMIQKKNIDFDDTYFEPMDETSEEKITSDIFEPRDEHRRHDINNFYCKKRLFIVDFV